MLFRASSKIEQFLNAKSQNACVLALSDDQDAVMRQDWVQSVGSSFVNHYLKLQPKTVRLPKILPTVYDLFLTSLAYVAEDTLREAKKIPSREFQVTGQGKTESKMYLKNGSLQIKLTLEGSQTNEKLLGIPYPSVPKDIADRYPSAFDQLSLPPNTDFYQLSFLVEDFLSNDFIFTPVYLQTKHFYKATAAYVDSLRAAKNGKNTQSKMVNSSLDYSRRVNKIDSDTEGEGDS